MAPEYESQVDLTSEKEHRAESLLSRIRGFVLAALVLGIVGTGAELLVAGHTDDTLQWAPLILILLSLLVLAWHAMARNAATVRVLQGVMILFVVAGGVGLVAHWKAKMEFKREMDPSLSGTKLFLEAMKSQSPPALAPGVLIQMALLGLTYTYRHPATGSPKSTAPTRTAALKTNTRSTI
jgi:hypothetical protein